MSVIQIDLQVRLDRKDLFNVIIFRTVIKVKSEVCELYVVHLHQLAVSVSL